MLSSFTDTCENVSCGNGFECEQCDKIEGVPDEDVGVGTYICVPEDSVFDSERV